MCHFFLDQQSGRLVADVRMNEPKHKGTAHARLLSHLSANIPQSEQSLASAGREPLLAPVPGGGVEGGTAGLQRRIHPP